ncbi:MAG TPA: OmpA family protein [Vicinamibacterales bacterium]|jgi:outer membrane protein OmpA-like peptidoglycan-associated protein|nr:OmpA family protein [Vicinamibacterales bacterium]
MRKSLFAASMLALTVAVAPACATKKFVRTEVGNVNTKVDTLSGTVEETQERTRQNEGRIGQVDTKAEAAGRSAQEARTAADAAAARANEVGTQVTQVNGRVDEVEAASRRLVYTVTLSEDQGNFKFGKTDLPDSAKQRLDEVISQLKAKPENIFIEIEGHTDNVGPKELNMKLGEERAEAVKRYLYEQHQIPLHKMNVISYGEDKPVAPNTTRQGRAQNRRVVVKVLS